MESHCDRNQMATLNYEKQSGPTYLNRQNKQQQQLDMMEHKCIKYIPGNRARESKRKMGEEKKRKLEDQSKRLNFRVI